MPLWRREAEAVIAATLGRADACWIEWTQALPADGSRLPRLVLSLVGHTPPSADRIRMLGAIGGMLAPGSTLVVVDHNRPRRASAAVAAVLGAPRVPGASPATRWRRLAYPTAREVQGAGFRVDRLRFAAGERLQLVFARLAGC